MQTKNRESGFGLIEAIIVIVIVAAIGVGGWYVWQKNQERSSPTAQQTTTTSNETASSIAADKQTFAIAEWNIDAKNKSAYELRYKMSSDKRYAYFTATALTAATSSDACGIEMINGVQMSGGGRIARYTADEKTAEYPDMTAQALAAYYDKDTTLKDKYTKVGAYYYFYITPQGACSDKSLDLQEKVNVAVNGLMSTFSAKN